MITFEKLFDVMKEKGKSTYTFRRDSVISETTLQRMRKNQSVSTETINKLCNYLGCEPMDIITYKKE